MNSNAEKLVLIVHAVDAEGPLYESLEATFDRLKEVHGIDGLPVNRETIRRLKDGEIPLGGKEAIIAEFLNSHRLLYNDSWEKIDDMMERITSEAFRMELPDSTGGGWIYNWHCMDHVGYVYNPRRRDIGYHNIHDYFSRWVASQPNCRDRIEFHFHSMSTYQDAHRCGTSIAKSPGIHDILNRRVIERQWFPSAYRAGFQTERPDIHHFLEQWIPYDLSSMALDDPSILEESIDLRDGRFSDWRLAPPDWSIYHPHHDNYQLGGNCRRWIGRCLNVMNRIASIDQAEMDKAFARAQSGRPTLVGISGHDFRDLGAEVDTIRELIDTAQAKYKDVSFKYCDIVEAFRIASGEFEVAADTDPLELEISLHREPSDDVPHMVVTTKKGKVFGPQPYLAIETMSRRFIHESFDFSPSGDRWQFAFYHETLPLDDVRRIGVAANDAYGNRWIDVIDVAEHVNA